MAVNILQITDTHIHDLDVTDFYDIQPGATLDQVIRHAVNNSPNIDLVVVTGDLTHDGGKAAALRLKQALQAFNCPIFIIPGNHDDERIIRHYLLDDQIQMVQQYQLEHWQLLFVDSHIQGQVHGEVTEQSMHDVRQYLDQCSKPALLFTHHPPVSINCPWLDRISMSNGEWLLQQLAEYSQLRAIVFGHIHQGFYQQWEHFLLLGCPSTCVQFKPSSRTFATDSLAPGYRLFSLNPEGDFNSQILRISNP